MTGNLNMDGNKIQNLEETSSDKDAAHKKYVDESHIRPSGYYTNSFRYLMEDIDESSSENNIEVIAIGSYAASIHQINKNAYQLSLIKDSGTNNYRSRIGFNLGSLSIGYYTFVCEFLPIIMSNVIVTTLGTTISINSQSTKTFPTYTKTLVQFHRWNSTPPQFIYLDIHGSASNSNSRVLAYMIVYGIEGYHPNVPTSIFDEAYTLQNGRMEMQTDLDLHGQRLLNNGQGGLSFDSGGIISLHDNLSTNNYKITGRYGGGFEFDDYGRTKMHEDLDLNGHGIHETLDFLAGNIRILKDINMNNKRITNIPNGVNNNDAINKNQMETYVQSQVTTPPQLNGAGPNTILSGKTPIYNSNGALYADRIRIRYTSNTIEIQPRSQSGNNVLYIPDLGGTDQSTAFQRPILEYIRGSIITSNELAFVFFKCFIF